MASSHPVPHPSVPPSPSLQGWFSSLHHSVLLLKFITLLLNEKLRIPFSWPLLLLDWTAQCSLLANTCERHLDKSAALRSCRRSSNSRLRTGALRSQWSCNQICKYFCECLLKVIPVYKRIQRDPYDKSARKCLFVLHPVDYWHVSNLFPSAIKTQACLLHYMFFHASQILQIQFSIYNLMSSLLQVNIFVITKTL